MGDPHANPSPASPPPTVGMPPPAPPGDPKPGSPHGQMVEGWEGGTTNAPPLPAVLSPLKAVNRGLPTVLPKLGDELGDFKLLRLLGEGSFAKVFLARQVSLDRQVALKVSANRGSEARTLASLEHDHIVHVFLEIVDRERDLRLLCMQYVPGTTLEQIIRTMNASPACDWSGRAILEAIDARSLHPPTFDPAALRDREYLASCDFIEAVCWLGARVAEALAYAHRQGVLHRDIKPANILINQYGRPLLADFNIAFDPHGGHGSARESFGGTLAYMAPEHLDAFNPEEATSAEAVDQRSDVYALGVVLFEFLTGRLPFGHTTAAADVYEALRNLANERRAGPPSVRRDRPDIPAVLDRTLQRCLDPRPERRYQTGAELVRALEGCAQLHRIHKELPPPAPFPSDTRRRPFLWLPILALMPHFLGSLVNIIYNSYQIVNRLTAAQQTAFAQLVLGYNVLVYPACLWVLYGLIRPAIPLWGRLARGELIEDAEVTRIRRGALTWPRWMIALSCIGWLPGTLVFPLGMHWMAEPVGLTVFGHFLISLTLSGLIAIVYSYFGVQFMVSRVLYPRLWVDAQYLRQRINEELGARPPRPWIFQLLAGTIPLAAAILMVVGGPEVNGYAVYRLLVTTLIGMGMVGFGMAIFATNVLTQTRAVLLNTEREARVAPRNRRPC